MSVSLILLYPCVHHAPPGGGEEEGREGGEEGADGRPGPRHLPGFARPFVLLFFDISFFLQLHYVLPCASLKSRLCGASMAAQVPS